MPRISSFYGIAIYIYYRDHAPPHFHAIYGEHEAAIQIASVSVIAGSLPGRAERLVMEWAIAHRAELSDDWNRAMRGEALIAIEPLI